MRQANIYYKDQLAGLLTETDEGEYVFQYDASYVKKHPDQFITFTMPVKTESYKEKRLFPFFEGLIPEGWLLDIAQTLTASQIFTASERDSMIVAEPLTLESVNIVDFLPGPPLGTWRDYPHQMEGASLLA